MLAAQSGEAGHHDDVDAVMAQPSLDAIGGSNMAPFLTKLFQIVSAGATDACIKWTPKGDAFVISDPDSFAREILPTYFKHNNIRSFIRQLNTYGFRKRTNISSTDEHLEFFHVSFRRDEPSALTQIKRCHQPKTQSQQSGGGGGAGQAPRDEIMDLSKQQSPDLDTIRNRVTELKTRLGSLQMEIRDYNQQMEQKVNLLMQILQTSSSPQGAMQMQQQLSRMGQAHISMGGQQHQSYGMDQHSGGFSNSLSSAHGADFFGRRDALLASLGQHGHHSGMGGNGISSYSGLPGLGMSGLGAGGLGGLGGALGGGLGSLGGFGGLAGLGAGGQKSADGGVGGVAGLQHLLEAAQRYQTEDTKIDANGHEQGRAAKRFCSDASQLSSARSEEARA